MRQNTHRTTRATVAATWTATVALALAAAPPATAAPAWLGQPDLSASGEDASLPSVAMSGAGDAVVAWQRASGAGFVAQASLRPAGTSFSAPIPLGAAGPGALGTPQAAIDAAGSAIVVWLEPDGLGANTIVRAAVRPAGGSFGASRPLSAPGAVATQPRIAMNAAGDAIVAWQHVSGGELRVQAVVRPAGGAFSAPVDVSDLGLAGPLPRAAIDGAGHATVVWTQTEAGGATVQAATRPAGGGFTAPVDLSAIGQAGGADVAANGGGETIAVWEHVDGTPNRIVQAAIRPAGGGFAAATDLSAPGRDATDPHVAIDAAGRAIAVWTRFDGTTRVVQAATRAAGGSFAAPVDLSLAGGEAGEPRVAVDPAGNAVAAWRRSDGANTIVQAAVGGTGAGFGATTDLSAAGQDAGGPQLGLDGDGDAVAAWRRSDGASTIVQAAGYDGAGPQLRGLTVPAGATTATDGAYGVAPLDVWSPVGATLWSFDDGTIAAGTNVTHTFATVGDHSATVTAADALGNTTTATRLVSVGAPDPAPDTPPTIIRPPARGCVGCTPRPPRLAVAVGFDAHVGRRYTVFTRLVVLPARSRMTVRVRCRGKGCPFVSRRRTVTKYARRLDLTRLVRGRRLRRGVELEIGVTKPNTIGTMATIGVRDRRRPRRILRCLFPGSSTPAICPL